MINFSGERIDTNTFILQNGDYTKSNGSLNGTLRPPKTPTLQKNGKPYHSNPVSELVYRNVKKMSVLKKHKSFIPESFPQEKGRKGKIKADTGF